MSDITISNDESQDEKRKTTPVRGPLQRFDNLNLSIPDVILQIWLGRRDSNPRMHGPKPCALPLGHAPILLYVPQDEAVL